MRTARRVALATVGLGLLVACGGGGDGSSQGITGSGGVNFSGAYAGTQTFTSGRGTGVRTSFNLTVIQDGNRVTGSYSTRSG